MLYSERTALSGDNLNNHVIHSMVTRKNILYYMKLAEEEANVIFGNRLVEYKYYNMNIVIEVALDKARQELKNERLKKQENRRSSQY